MEHGRRTVTAQERLEEKQIQESLNVSSYLGDVLESIHSGVKPKIDVPNYREPTRAEIYSKIATGQDPGMPSEVQGMSMDFDSITSAMSDEQVKTAMSDVHHERQGEQKTFSNPSLPGNQSMNRAGFAATRNQVMAIKKYPTLIEFLGRPEGEKVAKKIASDMNVIMAEMISANSKEASSCAVNCKAEKQNLRQYFRGEDWICRVTAAGPFHGDEAIFYSRDKDTAFVLRRSERDGEIHYADISDQFNLIYEAEQGEIPVIAEKEETTVEASAEQATSAAEEGENNEINADVKVDETAEVVESKT